MRNIEIGGEKERPRNRNNNNPFRKKKTLNGFLFPSRELGRERKKMDIQYGGSCPVISSTSSKGGEEGTKREEEDRKANSQIRKRNEMELVAGCLSTTTSVSILLLSRVALGIENTG